MAGMGAGRWLKALCLALLVVIVIDIGFIVRTDSLPSEACFTLAGVTAVAGVVPVVFAAYFVRVRSRL
jgi:hypothetical protein